MKKALQAPVRQIVALMRDEKGASLWEYALLVIIGLGIASILFGLREQIGKVFQSATDALTW